MSLPIGHTLPSTYWGCWPLLAAFVRRQLLAVQAVLALAADHRRLAFVQLHPHLARHEPLTARHEREQVLVERTKPQSIVDYIGVLLGHQRQEPLHPLVQAQR